MRYEIVEKCHFDDKNAIGQRKFDDVKPFDMRFQFERAARTIYQYISRALATSKSGSLCNATNRN